MNLAGQTRPLTGGDTDAALLADVLRPYRLHCRYLQTAAVSTDPVRASCDFVIPESCYIDDTGHFNAVEFNICYNQMAYYLIAASIKNDLIEVFEPWTLADFWRLQLGNILITDFKSMFRQQMRGRVFSGEVVIDDVSYLEGAGRWESLLVIRTSCRFWDESGGHCRGAVRIAITDPVGPR